jgi:hypothetical protein
MISNLKEVREVETFSTLEKFSPGRIFGYFNFRNLRPRSVH